MSTKGRGQRPSFVRELLGGLREAGDTPRKEETALLKAIDDYIRDTKAESIRVTANRSTIDLYVETGRCESKHFIRLPRGHFDTLPRLTAKGRWDKLIELANQTSMTAEEMAAEVRYSVTTVRKDLDELYDRRLIKRRN